MTAKTTIAWKRNALRFTCEDSYLYVGTMAGTNDYYAVSKRGRRWECWIAGQYLGGFKTMRAAKAAAVAHSGGKVAA